MEMAFASMGTGTGTAVSAAGTAGTVQSKTVVDGAVFAEIMGNQLSTAVAEEEQAPLDALLSGLMQVIPLLPPAIQEALAGTEADAEGMIDALLQNIQQNPEVLQQLVQSETMQSWLTEASAMLSVLQGTTALSTQAVNQPQDASLKLQKTLLDLTAMLKQQPDHPILQHLSKEFTQLLEKVLPQAASLAVNTEKPKSALNAVTDHASKLPASTGEPGLDTPVVTVTKTNPIKTSLEALAAKSSAWNVVRQTAELTAEPVSPQNSIPSEQADTTLMTGMQEMPKTAGTEQAAKTALPTIQASNLTQELSEFMVKRMNVKVGDGFAEAKLSLRPQHLGNIEITLKIQNGQLMAIFTADSAVGKELLDSQLSSLRQSLQSQGVQVDKMEVSQSSMSSSMFQDSRQQQSSQQFLQQHEGRESGSVAEEVTEWNEELHALTETRKAALGNSFETSA
ncbi:flagellar hook-length control protein FliK [Paenibacillus lutrae]|uniref:Flagellar hook-length control protein FliK n=1 Tax=Paenibacillus lutrae TaxID=2078573 RepID=A0A7X3FGC2_9BACL|nr:flagellar hook-length control protein FliK [Paenibacillus lutrae]MVO99156.1 flagellar hook-length control protein FliK [Paenibacillus lutrae]